MNPLIKGAHFTLFKKKKAMKSAVRVVKCAPLGLSDARQGISILGAVAAAGRHIAKKRAANSDDQETKDEKLSGRSSIRLFPRLNILKEDDREIHPDHDSTTSPDHESLRDKKKHLASITSALAKSQGGRVRTEGEEVDAEEVRILSPAGQTE